MKTSAEEKLKASKSWRKANAYNTREDFHLQKEICRLDRQVEREICQLRAAQNRFNLHYRKKSNPEKKLPVVLPPVQEVRDICREENDELMARQRARRMSKSLTSLPPLATDPLFANTCNVGSRERSSSLNSAASDPSPTKCKNDVAKEPSHGRRSLAGLSVTRTRLKPL